MAAALDELSHYAEFDYLVINDEFATALDALARYRDRQSPAPGNAIGAPTRTVTGALVLTAFFH
jgi:hypothetical protein